MDFEIERLPKLTASAVIHKTKAVFTRHGIPKEVVSDNGQCYNSHEYTEFAESWGFKHIISSPHYPQSNGLAEKTVQTAKRILMKVREDKKDPYLSLLEYRNTPVDGLKSPAQLLMSRRLRPVLPTTSLQLQPQITPPDTVRARREELQQRQQQHYNKSAKPLSMLPAGAPVRFQQEDGKWKPATVIQPDVKTRGAAILIRKNVPFNPVETIYDNNGRYVIVAGILCQYPVVLVNVYDPNHDDEEFKKKLISSIPK